MKKSPLINFGGFFVYNKSMNKSIWWRMKESIERVLPMTLGSFLLFAFVIYLFIIVGKSVWGNYQSNKDIENQQQRVEELKQNINILENEIAYYKTDAYKERQAREKLGYKAPGENVISLPFDQQEDKVADQGGSEPVIKTPNSRLWWDYFTRS